MDIKSIKRRLKEIREVAYDGDNEVAYDMEIELYKDFIQYIASGGGELPGAEPKANAQEVLKAGKIAFNRWTA